MPQLMNTQSNAPVQNDQALLDRLLKTRTPYQAGVEKALKKAGEVQALEALQGGVTPQHIEQQAGLDPKMLLSQLLGQQPQQMPTQDGQQAPQTAQATPTPGEMQTPPQAQVTPSQTAPMAAGQPDPYAQRAGQLTLTPKGILQRFMSGFSQDYRTAELANVATAQKIAGQEPLQAGDREKMGLDYTKDVAIKQYEIAAKAAEAGNLKPEHIFNKFEAASAPFITARDAHARLEEAAKDPSPAGDLALLYNYMKVLDPGSTVRESEFANAASSGSIPDQIRGQWSKVISGDRLAPRVRADFVDRSRRLFKGMEQQQKKTTQQFKTLAEKNGVNFENIVRDTGLAAEETESFVVAGKTYNIPKDKVAAFKKAKGL